MSTLQRFRRLVASLLGRSVVLSLVLCLTGLPGCTPQPLLPNVGVWEYQSFVFVDVPGGSLNVAGGNLVVRRTDLSIDTRLGTEEIGAICAFLAGPGGAYITGQAINVDGGRVMS